MQNHPRLPWSASPPSAPASLGKRNIFIHPLEHLGLPAISPTCEETNAREPLAFFFRAKYLLENSHFRAIFGPFSGISGLTVAFLRGAALARACFESCASPSEYSFTIRGSSSLHRCSSLPWQIGVPGVGLKTSISACFPEFRPPRGRGTRFLDMSPPPPDLFGAVLRVYFVFTRVLSTALGASKASPAASGVRRPSGVRRRRRRPSGGVRRPAPELRGAAGLWRVFRKSIPW